MRFVLVAALCLALPSPALCDDPFQSAPVPEQPAAATPAVRPTPHPRPAEAEPVVAPQPPPSRFSSAYIGRIKALAVSQQLGIPDAIDFREETTPVEYRGFLGAWGPGTWPDQARYLLVVEAVDADGSADLIRAWSSCCATKTLFPAGWEKLRGRISDGKLRYAFWRKHDQIYKRHEFVLARPDLMRSAAPSGKVEIELPRIQ